MIRLLGGWRLVVLGFILTWLMVGIIITSLRRENTPRNHLIF